MSGKEWPGDRGEVREAAGVGGIGLIGCFCGGDWELRLKDTEERFTQRYDGSLLGWIFFSPCFVRFLRKDLIYPKPTLNSLCS